VYQQGWFCCKNYQSVIGEHNQVILWPWGAFEWHGCHAPNAGLSLALPNYHAPYTGPAKPADDTKRSGFSNQRFDEIIEAL
jgi:hypothetical protein